MIMDNLVNFLCFILTTGWVTAHERAPIFKSIPTTVKTREHQTVLLPCFVEHIGSSSIKWWKDEEVVAEFGKTFQSNLLLHKNNSLEVMDVSSSDSGRYTCQVLRAEPWNPINQHHAIEVQFPPVITMTPELSEMEVELNQEIEITCEANGVPDPFLRWMFNGEEIKTQSSKNKLRFMAETGSLSGTYSCIATNGVGNSDVKEIDIRIVYAPRVSIEKTWHHSSPGVRTELYCNIEASPLAEVLWFFNDFPIEHNHRISSYKKNTRYGLVIKNTRITDFGYYTCKAINKLGKNQQTVELSPLPNKPTFKKTQQETYTNKSTLAWEVDSYSPIIQYTLIFRQHQLFSKTNWTELIIPAETGSGGPIHTQVFLLSGLQPASVYEACVLARNRFGWSRSSSIYRFATSGIDLDSYLAAETELESNTVSNDYLDISLYPVRKEYVYGSGSTLNWFRIELLFLMISLLFLN